MTIYKIKGFYDQKKPDREAALEAYRAIIAENQGEDTLNALAFLAADYAHPEALSLLFDAGVSPKITNSNRATLLDILAKQPGIRRYSYIEPLPSGAVAAAVNLLLDKNVDALNTEHFSDKRTCYHYAALKGKVEFVEALAKRGVRLDLSDRTGNNAVQIINKQKQKAGAKLLEDYFRLAKIFAEAGVDSGTYI